LTVLEIARATGKTPATVRSWIVNGELPALRLGRSILIPRDEYQAKLRARLLLRGFR
jgi:excisionase family DNA binding protein